MNPTKETPFPIPLHHYKLGKSLGGGSNSTFLLEPLDKKNPRLVLKYGTSVEALKMEHLCFILYKVLGVPTPRHWYVPTLPECLQNNPVLVHRTEAFRIMEYVETDVQDKAIIRHAAAAHFVALALLGNIDMKEDNWLFSPITNQCYLIDSGANFIFRSMGELRLEHPEHFTELDSLRNPSINPGAAVWFNHLSDTEIRQQIRAIKAAIPALEEALWEGVLTLKLAGNLPAKVIDAVNERLILMQERYFKSVAYAPVHRKASNHTGAGILTFRVENGEVEILLSQRIGHAWYDNFGGKSDSTDVFLIDTALREVQEESGGQLLYTSIDLLNAPFHDLVSGNHPDQFTYRMYFAEYHAKVNLAKCQDNEHQNTQWVKLSKIVEAIQSKQYMQLENRQTVVIHHDNQRIPLFPPLYQMLNQGPVYLQLTRLLSKQPLRATHTSGHEQMARPHEKPSRSIKTPRTLRGQVNQTLLRHAQMLQQIKESESLVSPALGVTISQSECHLKVVLGKEYQENAPETNVQNFLEKNFKGHYPIGFDQQLIELIQQEKATGEQSIFYYHGVSDVVIIQYEFYKELYQILRASPYWPVFRANQERFKAYENIESFIAQCVMGKYRPDDVGDFAAISISTNVFLFAHYTSTTSSSLHYCLQNDKTNRVGLDMALRGFLEAFSVPTEQIDLYNQSLAQLVERYREGGPMKRKCMGGALYQIELSYDKACQWSYASMAGGSLNPYEGSYDLPTVFHKLRIRPDIDYIKTLQARLLVPPSELFKVRSVIPAQGSLALKELRSEIVSIARSIAFSLLMNECANKADFIGQNIPLLRLQTELFAQLDQFDTLDTNFQGESTRTLLKAIAVQDVPTIVQSFLNKPNDLGLFLALPSAEPTVQDAWFYLYALLHSGHLPIIVVHAYRDILSRLMKNDFGVAQLLKALPMGFEANIAAKYESNLKEHHQLLPFILNYVPEENRMGIAIHFLPFLSVLEKPNLFLSILNCLKESDRLHFCKLYFKKPLEKEFPSLNTQIILMLLPCFPAIEDKIELIMHLSSGIKTGYELADILSVLPNSHRMKIARHCRDVIFSTHELEQLQEQLTPKEGIELGQKLPSLTQLKEQLLPGHLFSERDVCAYVDERGDLYFAGHAMYFEHSTQVKNYQLTPKKLNGVSNVKQVVFSCTNAYLLHQDGTVTTKPEPKNEQYYEASKSSEFVLLRNLDHIVSMAAGTYDCLFLREDGALFIHSSATSYANIPLVAAPSKEPQLVPNIPPLKAIYSAGLYAILEGQNGLFYCIGANSSKQLGIGSNEDLISDLRPMKTLDTYEVKALSLTNQAAYAVLNDGCVLTWGNGKEYPELIDGLTNVDRIFTDPDSETLVCLLKDGRLRLWGERAEVLGWDYLGCADTPEVLFPDVEVSDVALSRFGIQILLKDGQRMVQGRNEVGELGLGDTKARNTLVFAPGFTRAMEHEKMKSKSTDHKKSNENSPIHSFWSSNLSQNNKSDEKPKLGETVSKNPSNASP